jgi:hypothetical protein
MKTLEEIKAELVRISNQLVLLAGELEKLKQNSK